RAGAAGQRLCRHPEIRQSLVDGLLPIDDSVAVDNEFIVRRPGDKAMDVGRDAAEFDINHFLQLRRWWSKFYQIVGEAGVVGRSVSDLRRVDTAQSSDRRTLVGMDLVDQDSGVEQQSEQRSQRQSDDRNPRKLLHDPYFVFNRSFNSLMNSRMSLKSR